MKVNKFLLLIFILVYAFIIGGCSNNQNTNINNVHVKNEKENNKRLSIQEIRLLFNFKKEDILNKLGKQYSIIPMGAEGTDNGYKFEKLGIALVFEEDNDLGYISCDDTFELLGVRAGMQFEKIKEKLGKSQIKEIWFESPGNKAYELTYYKEGIKLSFISFEEDGKESMLTIYKQ